MSLATANAATTWRANRNGGEKFARAAVADASELTDDLIEARINVVGKLNLGDGSESVNAHADGRADNAAFSNGCIDYPVFAKFSL